MESPRKAKADTSNKFGLIVGQIHKIFPQIDLIIVLHVLNAVFGILNLVHTHF